MFPNNQHPTAVRKHLLDDLDRLPGESGADKERIWNNLQQRMGDRPRRKTGYWYYAAAACLLLAIVLWPSREKPDTSASSTAITKIPETSPSYPPEIRPAPEVPGKTSSGTGRTIRKISSPVPKLKMETTPEILIPKPDSIFIARMDIRNTADSSIPETIQLKKKLKVVHINQLNGPDFPPVIVSGKQGSSRNDGSVLIRLN